jgi:hypothetical protein
VSPGHATDFQFACTTSQANHRNAHFICICKASGPKDTSNWQRRKRAPCPYIPDGQPHCTGGPLVAYAAGMIKYDNRRRMCVRMAGPHAPVHVLPYVPQGRVDQPICHVSTMPSSLLQPLLGHSYQGSSHLIWVSSRQAALSATTATLPRTSVPAATQVTRCSQSWSGGVGAGAADGLVAGGRTAQGGGVQRGARPDDALPQLRVLLPQLLHLGRAQQWLGCRSLFCRGKLFGDTCKGVSCHMGCAVIGSRALVGCLHPPGPRGRWCRPASAAASGPRSPGSSPAPRGVQMLRNSALHAARATSLTGRLHTPRCMYGLTAALRAA